MLRTRWAAVGAAVAVSLGAGGIGISYATVSSGERAVYVPIEPCRLADLRPAPDTVGPRTAALGPAETYTITARGAVGDCNLPNGATALALNVTALNASVPTNLRFFPAGGAVPTAANLNPAPGQPPTPNAVNVDLDGAGRFSVYNRFGSVNVVMDVVGYYEDHNHDDRYYTKGQIDARNPQQAIPSGVTVTGSFQFDSVVWADVGNDHAYGVDLPGIAPVALTATTVNFAPTLAGVGNAAWISDGDATCTGTASAPTAPAGKVCIYAEDLRNVRNVAGSDGLAFDTHLDDRGFVIEFDYQAGTAAAGADFGVNATWAYTAP